MNTNPQHPLYTPPGADPLLPSSFVGSTWPKVLGILGILFGGAALLLGAFGVVAKKVALDQYEKLGMTEEMLTKHHLALDVAPLLSAALGFLLLLGGILLLLRKPVSRPLILSWAMAKIAYALWQAPLGLALQKDLMPLQQKMMTKDGAAPPEMGAMLETMGNAMQIVAVLWLCALPIFMLIWFMRSAIRSQVRTWTDVPAGAPDR